MPAAARQADTVTATDTHIVLVPSVTGAVPTPMPLPFNGRIADSVSPDVRINGRPAAVIGSVAVNVPPHVPSGGPFQRPPSNKGTVQTGSTTVQINGKAAARQGDTVATCNDPNDLPVGRIQTGSTNVSIG
jgi:uncharacterized Zn-binding protein involved in type VI secretion